MSQSLERVETQEVQDGEGLKEALDSICTHSARAMQLRYYTQNFEQFFGDDRPFGTDSSNREFNVLCCDRVGR